ncbi:hypothetical protein GJAV_G00234460 [Gymnothorax javanicus]|nr:hypothetical protein GJAV_G00234460 [Gymnothorax javanicus]
MTSSCWGYGEDDGPIGWHKVFPIALGDRQSPINIVTAEAVHDSNLLPLVVSYEHCSSISMSNNGHSVAVEYADAEQGPVIEGGPLSDTYRLKQFHFHWGHEDCHGSEHTVDGKTYASELHLVHWNTSKYQDFREAVTAPDGLAVLGVFLETGKEHTGLLEITDALCMVKFKGSTADLKDFNPKCLLPNNLNYWTYLGSLTTPPLHESVTWIVFEESIEVSKKQMEQFRQLLFTAEEDERKFMENNFRPPQPLKGRKRSGCARKPGAVNLQLNICAGEVKWAARQTDSNPPDFQTEMSGTLCSWVLHCAKSTTLSLSRHQQCRLFFSCCLSPHSKVTWPKRIRLSSSSSSSGSEPGPGSASRAQRHSSTRQDLQYHLTRAQINGILRANEQSVRIPEFDGRGLSAVLKFESNQLPANTPNEDRRSAATCLQTKGMMFGVFDGHGGYACAQAVSERLLYYVAVALMSRKSLSEVEDAMENLRPVPPILQWFKHHNDYNYRESASLYVEHLRVFWQELLASEDHEEGMLPRDALEYAFRRLDEDISLEAQVPLDSDLMRNTALQVAFAGSTACVAHVDTEGVHVANSGDCRAVLGAQEEDGSWSALPLSRDHNALNAEELERVRGQHPGSERDTVVTEERLLGILMPLRAFGDVRFKWSRDLQQSVLDNDCDLESLNIYQYTPPNYHTPPYLEATPELTYHRLRPQDRFLILASDGLWDLLGSQEAVRLVAEHLTGIHLQEPLSASERQMSLGQMHSLLLQRRARATPALDPNAATHLIRHALATNDYGQLDQERLSTMLALPEDLARMYRDDITVTIVYFNSNLIKTSDA